MTLDLLCDLAVEFFSVKKDDINSKSRELPVVIAKHCFRVLAKAEYGFSDRAISEFNHTDAAGVYNSEKVILKDENFKSEYESFKAYVYIQTHVKPDVVKDPITGIERVTSELFDERFYFHPKRVNTKTGLPYFPAYHFITALGDGEPKELKRWRQLFGLWADVLLVVSNHVGTFVHDSIDNMIVHNTSVDFQHISEAFPSWYDLFSDAIEINPKRKVQRSLWAFMNFMNDEEPEILESEKMECGDDFGFTKDIKCRLKSDDYKDVWVLDWKTSKSASESHKKQVEVMRRVSGADRAAVCVLGNKTSNGYTLTKVPKSNHDKYWMSFLGTKANAYVKIKENNLTQPRQDDMPTVFNLDNIKFKRNFT